MTAHGLTLKERIESHIICTKDCWITNYKFQVSSGRPIIGVNGKMIALSRAAYEVYKGKVPADLLVRNTCNNPICINPDHLFLCTVDENMIDLKKKNRLPKGSRHGNAKLTEVEVAKIRDALLAKTFTISQIAKTFNVSRSVVSKINTGRSWTHVEGIVSNLDSNHTNSRLTEDKVRQIKRLLATGIALRKIAKEFDVSYQTISNINHNRFWSHVTLD